LVDNVCVLDQGHPTENDRVLFFVRQLVVGEVRTLVLDLFDRILIEAAFLTECDIEKSHSGFALNDDVDDAVDLVCFLELKDDQREKKNFFYFRCSIYSRYSLYEHSYNELAKTSTRYMNIRYMKICVI
jgi:hypothetical protein